MKNAHPAFAHPLWSRLTEVVDERPDDAEEDGEDEEPPADQHEQTYQRIVVREHKSSWDRMQESSACSSTRDYPDSATRAAVGMQGRVVAVESAETG